MSLTKRQKSLLSKHSDHHSKKHMDEMKKAMTKKNPLTFSQAHKKAMDKVGK
jgi:hypothetical protein|tara:strand:+ start:1546 stop:1701 length:156 start_codon:yes stop_codon:yes gene_type:complete